MSTYPPIMFTEGNIHDQEVYIHCAASGQPLTATYHVSADSSVVSIVAQGLGITIMSRLAV